MICTWTTSYTRPDIIAATLYKKIIIRVYIYICIHIKFFWQNSIHCTKTHLSIALELALRFLLCLILLAALPLLLLLVGWLGGYLEEWLAGTYWLVGFCDVIGGPLPTGETNPVDDEAIFTAIAIVIDCWTARILSYSWWQNNLQDRNITINKN